MPTINGRKVVNFRLVKEGFQAIFEDDADKYTHVGGGNYKPKGKEDDENDLLSIKMEIDLFK